MTTNGLSKRSASAVRRRISQRFSNRHDWEPQQYQITVVKAMDESVIMHFGCNDHALVGYVFNLVAQRLLLQEDRFQLLLDGRVIDEKSRRASVMVVGNFLRELRFECVIVPPQRCAVCMSLKRRGFSGYRSRGTFIRGTGLLDYTFVHRDGSVDIDRGSSGDDDDCYYDRAHRYYDDDRGSSGDDEECYCDAIAKEFGWKVVRSWAGLTERLRLAVLRKRATESRVVSRIVARVVRNSLRRAAMRL